VITLVYSADTPTATYRRFNSEPLELLARGAAGEHAASSKARIEYRL